MWILFKNSPHQPPTQKKQKHVGRWLGVSFRPENFIPGLIIGFIIGLSFDFLKLTQSSSQPKKSTLGKHRKGQKMLATNSDDELKMVLVVRQDLKMGAGKIASQCAHAATGLYSLLIQSERSLLKQWEQCGQAKIVVTCKNQQEMNRLHQTVQSFGLPSYIVADAGRTQVSAGSKTVLAIGPGSKTLVDSVTGKLRLL